MECVIYFECYRSKSYRSRDLGVDQEDLVAVECVWLKFATIDRSRSYRSRGLGVEEREGLAVECVSFNC